MAGATNNRVSHLMEHRRADFAIGRMAQHVDEDQLLLVVALAIVSVKRRCLDPKAAQAT
jgi:hypothetical protein